MCVTHMDFTACAFSRERLASMSRKTMQIANQSEIQAFVPFKSTSVVESVFSLPSQVYTWHSTLHCDWASKTIAISDPASPSPLTPVPITKGLRKTFSTSRLINLALCFRWPSTPLFPKMCQDFQQKEYTTMHSVSPKTLSFAQVKVSEELKVPLLVQTVGNSGLRWTERRWEIHWWVFHTPYLSDLCLCDLDLVQVPSHNLLQFHIWFLIVSIPQIKLFRYTRTIQWKKTQLI